VSNDLKQCCARLYESELVTRLLGDSFHPGGPALTERLGELLRLTPETGVLDVAAGRGTSACLLARRFGCSVTGVDLSADNLARARADAAASLYADRLTYVVADAERLPFEDASFDAIICECAFCTFPDKQVAAAEFARVLKRGGAIGISDLTRAPTAPEELADLMSWIACISGATSAREYADWLTRAGLMNIVVEPHDDALVDMIKDIRKRLFGAEVLVGLNKIAISGVDFSTAARLARQALEAVRAGRLGYTILCGIKP
jgi:ubiquinone/menaquinone biosynthesis C-methylase UbiE